MTIDAVVGAQWGDEGKGRIVDFLVEQYCYDVVIRFQGGDNAGHTVKNNYGTFKLHITPSGVFNERSVCIIGAGCVVNPDVLIQEMKTLRDAGVGCDNITIDQRANIIMPWHVKRDSDREKAESDLLGTTKRGIWPVYSDKIARLGIRFEDLFDLDMFTNKVDAYLAQYQDADSIDRDALIAKAHIWHEELIDCVEDSTEIIADAIANNNRILLEGQLGIMRDLDWGLYPFVTSSNSSSLGIHAGAGIPANLPIAVLGIVKPYVTSVGGGALPGELSADKKAYNMWFGNQGEINEEDVNEFRNKAGEYGATTGRPRRIAALDLVALKYSQYLQGFDECALVKLDVLTGLDTIPVCVEYTLDGRTYHSDVYGGYPAFNQLDRISCHYRAFKGWQEDVTGCREFSELPEAAQDFIIAIEQHMGVKFSLISVGPERDQIIER